MKTAIVAFCLVGLFVSRPGLAWREAGHFTVCEIAERRLAQISKTASDRVAEILGGPFAEQCTWPDMIRKSTANIAEGELAVAGNTTYDWHFINRDFGKSYFDPAEVNLDGDVVQAILRAERRLVHPTIGKAEAKAWLRFLGHFTGDIHQPLHTGQKRDLGGNNVKLKWFNDSDFESVEILRDDSSTCSAARGPFIDRANGNCERGAGGVPAKACFDKATGECVKVLVTQEKVSLHKIWDLQFISRFISGAQLTAEAGDSRYRHKAYATAVLAGVSASQLNEWEMAPIESWMEESFEYREKIYELTNASASPPGVADKAYYDAHIDYINQRVVQAGSRLAVTLARIYDPASLGLRGAFLSLQDAEMAERVEALRKSGESVQGSGGTSMRGSRDRFEDQH